jgi:hypothetical protein
MCTRGVAHKAATPLSHTYLRGTVWKNRSSISRSEDRPLGVAEKRAARPGGGGGWGRLRGRGDENARQLLRRATMRRCAPSPFIRSATTPRENAKKCLLSELPIGYLSKLLSLIMAILIGTS